MNKKTRYFLFSSSGLLILGLSIGLMAFYGGLPEGVFGDKVGPAELPYVPSDASAVAYANVRQVMTSQLRQRIRQFEPMPEKGQQEFRDQTGINIETDIDHVVAYMAPADGQAGGPHGVVFARGKFDASKIEALAREHGGRIEEYKGKRIALMHEGDADAPFKGTAMGVAFIEPGLVALGSMGLIRRAIDTKADATQSLTSNAEVMGRIKDLSTGTIWAIGRFDALSSQAKLPAEVMSKIPAVSWISASGRVNGGITGLLQAEARDDEAAKNLRDIVSGFLALARLGAGSHPQAQAILPSLQLGGTGKTVTLSFTVSNEVFDAFAPKKKETPPADDKKS